MASCNDCYFAGICEDYENTEDFWCRDFRDYRLIVELPCKRGDKVWYIDEHNEIHEDKVSEIIIRYFYFDLEVYHVYLDKKRGELNFSDFGKTVFLTREEAEQALNGSEFPNSCNDNGNRNL